MGFGIRTLGSAGWGSASNFEVWFFDIYVTTLVEGLFLPFLLFILSFIATINLQMRDRKNPALWRGSANP